jgi:DNA-binding NtrC family response regulator
MSKRVLVVDDEADFCRLMVLHLKRRGFDAVGTDDPQEAVTIVKEAGPGIFGVVVTDWMMPRMSGNELILNIVDIDPEVIPIAITADCDHCSGTNGPACRQGVWRNRVSGEAVG